MIASIRVDGARYDSTENILKYAVSESSDIFEEKSNNKHTELFDHPVPDADFDIKIQPAFDIKDDEAYAYNSVGKLIKNRSCKIKVNIKA